MESEPSLATERLKLRRPVARDIPNLARLWTDPAVRAFLGGPTSTAEAQRRAKSLVGRENGFAVERQTDQTLLGLVTLDDGRPEGTEVSYLFLPEYWGQGYAQEAVAAVIAHAFTNLRLDRLIAATQTANVRSCKLLESLGMKPVMTFEEFGASQTMFEGVKGARPL